MTRTPPQSPFFVPAVGALVITPSGRTAIVEELHHDEREASVQWLDGSRGRFRFSVIRLANLNE